MGLDELQPLWLESDYGVACLRVRRSAGVLELGKGGALATASSRHSALSSLGNQYARTLLVKSI